MELYMVTREEKILQLGELLDEYGDICSKFDTADTADVYRILQQELCTCREKIITLVVGD